MSATILSIARVLGPAALGLWLGAALPACTSDGEGDDSGGSSGALMCEHGTVSACACSDGSMGTQMCMHDGSGFQPCTCDGESSSGGADGSSGTSDASATSGSEDPSTSDASSTSSGTDPTATSEETGPVGAPPTADINHPGDGEERVAGVPIPFIGSATDPEDGALAGASLVWVDDVDGEIGQGETFDAALMTLGAHVITLTATDADGNIGEDSVALTIVAP